MTHLVPFRSLSVHPEEKPRPWICCQLGAREHYTVPRALHRTGALDLLITDLWAAPRSIWGALPSSAVRQRFHSELEASPVAALNWLSLAFEAQARLRWQGWKRIVARNQWFGRAALREVERQASKDPESQRVVFSYCYTAREVFKFAKSAGWTTVLGQIDAGPVEEQLVGGVYRKEQGTNSDWRPAPSEYWDRWREECELADHILVNSTWSRDALITSGVGGGKLRVIPLAYEQSQSSASYVKDYPREFSGPRRLRVLFLGQVGLRKGINLVFDAIRLLESEPVEFRIVGPIQVLVPELLSRNPNVLFTGPVTRSEVGEHYRWADLFIFPTFSDGFGLTQLEAQSWSVPVVASRFCGDVVQHRRNGILLDELSGEAIARCLRSLLATPSQLERMSSASGVDRQFTIPRLAASLGALVAGSGDEPNA